MNILTNTKYYTANWIPNKSLQHKLQFGTKMNEFKLKLNEL